jgi:RNA polymerase-binding protein DksA
VKATAAPAKAAPAKAPAKVATPKPAPVDPGPALAEAAAVKAAAIKAATPKAAPAPPAVPEVVWTADELAEIRGELDEQARELSTEIDEADRSWSERQRDSGDSAGDDQADAGSKTFEREHELSLAANSRDLLTQVERALARLDDGTYGRCENCGNSISKPRLQAFPRATLCLSCKQREERR